MYYKKVGDGPPIVFLHGWGCDGSIFEDIVFGISGFSCYLVDLCGFGQSPLPPEEGWNVTDYAMSLHQLLNQLQVSSATIVGHSFGCRVAMVFSAMYPQCVKQLLLVAPAGLRKFSIGRSLKVFRYKINKLLNRLIGKRQTKNWGSEDYKNCNNGMKNTFVKVVNQNLAPFAKRISCRVLILNGRQDKQTPLSHAKRLNKIIRNSTLVALNGDHFCFFANAKSSSTVVQMFAGEG